jgi:2-dehydropantoate 2-reductase
MKIAIIGTGGVGGYFGGLLARAGEQVTFVARGEHFAKMRESGLTVKNVEGDFHLEHVNVVDSISKLERPDLVLITTKTYDRDSAARDLIQVVGPETIVIPIQNGIDNDVRVREILTVPQVYTGLAYIISARTAPGIIEQTAGPRTIIFGDRTNPSNPKLKQVESVMKSAGIRATFAEDIDRELWLKFLWITTFAGMTSMCRSPIGRIVNDPEAFRFYLACLDEALAVAQALKLKVGPADREEIVRKSEHYQHTGSQAKSSMLIDIENGRPTEIEALNGTLVRMAREAGVSVPHHEAIYHSVRLSTAS